MQARLIWQNLPGEVGQSNFGKAPNQSRDMQSRARRECLNTIVNAFRTQG